MSVKVRRDWLAVLARAPRERLAALADACPDRCFELLRSAETGLVMLRGRIANRGDRFNLGEATLTRCVVRCLGANGQARVGVGYVLGRDADRARWIAQFDALLQCAEQHRDLMRDVIEPLREATARQHAVEQAQTAASRVRFEALQSDGVA